jgi:hypothetical protein
MEDISMSDAMAVRILMDQVLHSKL